jgi:ribose 5-phosphate isomerase B
MKTIGIANDHAGFMTKIDLMLYLREKCYLTIDYGADTIESVDYADYAHRLVWGMQKGDCDVGIAICCTGNGINMTMNKYDDIRAALCWSPEISRLARTHNNANVCSIPANFVDKETVFEIIDIFLRTEFEGGRHQRRIDKIARQHFVL